MNNAPNEIPPHSHRPHQPPVEYDAPLDNDALRPHVFDGIQEYDKRLPNWWLWTLYGAIAFAFGYWSLFHHWNIADEPGLALEKEMKANMLAAAANSGVLDDGQMWQMSHDSAVIGAGQATFNSTCASCHGADAGGKIGPSLKDEIWLHGGTPHEIIATITNGVSAKGMPTWGPVLGKKKINEVTAYILSLHTPPAAPPQQQQQQQAQPAQPQAPSGVKTAQN